MPCIYNTYLQICRYILCSQLHVTVVLGGKMVCSTLKTKSLMQINRKLPHREIVKIFFGSATPHTMCCLHELNIYKGHKTIIYHSLLFYSLPYNIIIPFSFPLLHQFFLFLSISSNFFNNIGAFRVRHVFQYLFLVG